MSNNEKDWLAPQAKYLVIFRLSLYVLNSNFAEIDIAFRTYGVDELNTIRVLVLVESTGLDTLSMCAPL